MRLLANGMTRRRRTHMTRAGKATACVCIFSVLYMGCYISTLIDPTGAERDKMHTGKIEYLITKDSTKFEFDRSPTVTKDAIVGQVKGEQVSIPLSDVANVYVSEFGYWKAVQTTVGVAVIGVFVATGIALIAYS
jgi:hypothetical protein